MAEEENPIHALVADRGQMSFREFMEIALYHPEHGYYGSGRARIGRGGDFFTSVSVGAIYGKLLALQFAEMWDNLGKPGHFTVVEQGAHDGTLAADVLTWCRAEVPAFFEALRYDIVESNRLLRECQIQRLGDFLPKVRWWDSLDALPPFCGVHFSNELIDAFPVHLVRYWTSEWSERHVTGEMEWAEEPVRDHALQAQLSDLPRIEGYTTEINLDAMQWAKALAARVIQGWVLAIDYGYPRAQYYAPERTQGTLQCYAAHSKDRDPLATPGFCDLTAHVDFTSLARSFISGGMEIAGYVDQHHFLTGIVARAFMDRPPSSQDARGLKTLLHPEMLGTAFKVLAMQRNVSAAPLSGFQFGRDPVRELGL